MFDETFNVSIPYDKDCLSALSGIMGRNFDKKKRSHEFPAIEIFNLAEKIKPFFPQVAKWLTDSPKYEKERQLAKEAEHMVCLSRAKRVRFDVPIPDGLSFRQHQKAGVYYSTIHNRDNVLIADEMGTGKEQPLTAGLLTPHGWKTMGDAKVGMRIIGSDGKHYFIKKVFPQGVKPAYKIYFSDDTTTTCGLDHLWLVMSDNRRVRKQPPVLKTTREIMKGKVLTKNGYPKWYVPLIKPVRYVSENLPLNPYLLGALIGDGYLCGSTICISIPNAKVEILEKVKMFVPSGTNVTGGKTWNGSCPQYNLGNGVGSKSEIKQIIQNLKLDVKSPLRFIPEMYLKGNPDDRLELLRGLMDTDGSARNNRVHYFTTSLRLAEDVRTLVRSLGGLAWINSYNRDHDNKSTEHSVLIRMDVCPFHLKYKAAGWKKPLRSQFKWIEKIEYIGDVEQQCIRVSSPDHLYVTDDFIATHNSPMTIGIANYNKFKKGLIISPNSAKINWQRECLKWSTVTDNIGVIDSKSTEKQIGYYDYCVINYDILQKHQSVLTSIDWDFVVCDEAHMMKNPKAIRTKIAMDLCDRADYRALLTGSPIVNRPHELWNLIHTLNPVFWRNWMDFVYTYCDAYKNPYTGEFDFKGASNLPELQDKLRMTLMLRRLKKDVLKDLPPKTRQLIEIPASRKFTTVLAAQAKYVGKIAGSFDASDSFDAKLSPEENEKKFRDKIKKMGKLSSSDFEEIQKLRHMTALAKAPEVGEFAKEILESKPKIGLYAHHRDVLDYFIKLFGKQAVSIIGGDSVKKRQIAIDRFQTDPSVKVFIGSIQAAGTAITLTASDVCIFAEMDFVPGINGQVEDRFHRIGTVNPVNIYYTMLQGSLDWYIANMVISKLENIEKALDTKQTRIGFRRRIVK